jgi:hypothetical protein
MDMNVTIFQQQQQQSKTGTNEEIRQPCTQKKSLPGQQQREGQAQIIEHPNFTKEQAERRITNTNTDQQQCDECAKRIDIKQ